MKYGLMEFPYESKRIDRPDMNNLPEKCCAKCWQWCECFDRNEQSTCYGHCFEHSTDEWDEFSWADDDCYQFDARESEE